MPPQSQNGCSRSDLDGLQGISDTPAWIVAKANLYARLMGKTPFVIYQGAWSILQRDFEREILPMARAEGGLVLAGSIG